MLNRNEPGRYIPRNIQGFFENDAQVDYIEGLWYELVVEAKLALISWFKSESIHSIYVRGTVARGQAVPYVSDLDLVLIANYPVDELTWYQNPQVETILASYNFAVKIDLTAESILNGLSDETKFLLKTQGVCIYGRNIIAYLPDYQILSLPLIYIPIFSEQLRETIALIQTSGRELMPINDVYMNCCRRIMKQIIRVAGMISVDVCNEYSPDLYLAYTCFKSKYPELAPNIEMAMRMVNLQNMPPSELLRYLTSFGQWLLERLIDFDMT